MAVYHASEASARHPALIGLDLPLAFAYGPLLYLYVRTFAGPAARLRPSDAWHAVPFVTAALFFVPLFMRTGPEKLAVLADPGLAVQTRALVVINPLKMLHGAVYLVLIVAVLRRATRQAEGAVRAERVRLRWLQILTAGVVTMLGVSVVLYGLGGRGGGVGMDPDAPFDDFTLLAVTVFVYAIGYFGLRQPEITTAPPEAEPPATEPYARSGMTPEEAERYRDRLVVLMETERLYRRGDLTLPDLAGALGVTPHNLTEVLSTQLGQTFYEVVNGYRVREVKARLVDPAFADWTVLAIGMEAGFNAKSSFNAAFKRHAGVTPSEYRRQRAEAA
jgi:AraC-like DNA-binding protein